MQAISINNVTKTFKTPKDPAFKAVNNVTLSIEEGKIYGLLGPNGAGKSTLINMISGVLAPDHGTITVLGTDVTKNPVLTKQMLGVVPQEIVVEPAFTVEEVLYYYSGMFGVPASLRKERIATVLRDLSLEEKAKDKARSLSGGMKRRLMIAKAMLHQPKILILDEPTAGVDVSLRQKIWELVRRLNKQGTTIIFTTHYLEEAEELCEAITLINHGQIIKSGKVKDLQEEFSKNAIHFELFDRSVAHLPGVVQVGTAFQYPMKNLGQDMALLTKHYDGNIKSIRSEAASLEYIFLRLTEPHS